MSCNWMFDLLQKRKFDDYQFVHFLTNIVASLWFIRQNKKEDVHQFSVIISTTTDQTISSLFLFLFVVGHNMRQLQTFHFDTLEHVQWAMYMKNSWKYRLWPVNETIILSFSVCWMLNAILNTTWIFVGDKMPSNCAKTIFRTDYSVEGLLFLMWESKLVHCTRLLDLFILQTSPGRVKSKSNTKSLNHITTLFQSP